MEIITWLVVGLIAGVLASTVLADSGLGLVGDIVLGIIGAFVGSWVFRELGWHAPFEGILGVIAVAFVGALIVLFGLRLVNGVMGRS